MADTKTTALTEVSVPELEDLLYLVEDPSGTPTSRKATIRRVLGCMLPSLAEGRLTLESGVPVSTSDQTAKTTIYYTPYRGKNISLYDGTRWRLYSFSEISLALGTLSGDKNYDVFLYDNSGTLTLELSAAWTNGTTRADALTTQDGIYVKSGATTRRHVGTIRMVSQTQTEDSAVKRFIWNRDNRVRRRLYRSDPTASWTYSTDSFRQANASSSNQVEVVVGAADSLLDLHIGANVQIPAIFSGADAVIAIGEDSTTAAATGCVRGNNSMNNVSFYNLIATHLVKTVPLGYHYYAWLERADQATTNWYGDNGDYYQSAMYGFMES